MTYVATALDVSPARVFGVATFYSHFAIKPKGKHLVRLCDGTACHVKDSIPILDAIRKRLKLEGKKNTTDDMLFTVETVACLGRLRPGAGGGRRRPGPRADDAGQRRKARRRNHRPGTIVTMSPAAQPSTD